MRPALHQIGVMPLGVRHGWALYGSPPGASPSRSVRSHRRPNQARRAAPYRPRLAICPVAHYPSCPLRPRPGVSRIHGPSQRASRVRRGARGGDKGSGVKPGQTGVKLAPSDRLERSHRSGPSGRSGRSNRSDPPTPPAPPSTPVHRRQLAPTNPCPHTGPPSPGPVCRPPLFPFPLFPFSL